MRVQNVADDLIDGATIARDGAADINAAQRRLREAVANAQDAGFHVGDDCTVTSVGSVVEQAQLSAQAESLAEDIRYRASELVDTDQHVSSRVTNAVDQLAHLFFPEADAISAIDNRAREHVQFIGNFGPKESPNPKPGVPDDFGGRGTSPSATDIRGVLEKLPEGDRPWIREVRTPEDLHRLWKWMEQNGIRSSTRYGDPSKGVWKNLPDGSGVGQRFSAGSTKSPVLDINLRGNEHWKVHINPRTGGIPEIPGTHRAPTGAASGRSAAPGAVPSTVVEGSPASQPPIRGGPLGGLSVGGGVFPDGSTPHFIEPPGPDVGGPDLPVVGDGKPDRPET